MRLIDSDALMKRMCAQCNIEMADAPCEPADCFVRTVIMDAPTIDAVPVVRCKECEYWNTDEKSYFGTKCRCERFSLVGYSENYVLPNDFCSYGERRSE